MHFAKAGVFSLPPLRAVYASDIGDGTFVETPDTRKEVSRSPMGSTEMGDINR